MPLRGIKAMTIKNGSSTPTIIYIMGYGRSGSTILDMLLQQHYNIVSAGALNNIYDWQLNSEKCSCGNRLSDCSFWFDVLTGKNIMSNSTSPLEARTLQFKFERLSVLWRLITGSHSEHDKSIYREGMRELYGNIADVASVKFIVDSSKSTRDCTGRALALGKVAHMPVKSIWLTRDGRGVGWSAIRRTGSDERKRVSEKPSVNFIRTVLSWSLTNLLTRITTLFMKKGTYMHVKYEELCKDPDETLSLIGEFLDLDMKEVINSASGLSNISAGHNLGGNRLRFETKVRLKPDLSWHKKLPKQFRILFLFFGSPIGIFMGYKLW